MKLRPEEITSILRERIEHYDVETDLAEVGTVLSVGSCPSRASRPRKASLGRTQGVGVAGGYGRD